jgi:membrane associated rhomboid family serine protease
MSQDNDLEAKLKQMMAEIQCQPDQNSQSRAISAQPETSPHKRKTLSTWNHTFFLPLIILCIPWTQEIIDQLLHQGTWNMVVHPRSIAGIPGIFLSAFSHSGFSHLISNSIAFAIFSWLILLKSQKDFWISFLIGWLGGGLACWLFGFQSVHGLSGVVYTLFGYLLAIGWLGKRFVPLAISVFVMINFGHAFWGIFPTEYRVAWWGHLFGLLLGFFSAYGVYREPK